jgi:alpha-D-ribose 1-methylphosphonate 5-triphosphate synthase subunit PhnG
MSVTQTSTASFHIPSNGIRLLRHVAYLRNPIGRTGVTTLMQMGEMTHSRLLVKLEKARSPICYWSVQPGSQGSGSS